MIGWQAALLRGTLELELLVGLISICAPSEDDSSTPRGLLRFAGQSVAARQIDLALSLGCERIVCMVEDIGQAVIDLQQKAREGGAKFNAVSGGLSLMGIVTSGDEIIAFADGILPQADAVERHLGDKPGVLVIPADGAVEEGYERIDAEWAWAGVLRARGSIVEALSQLPPDIDPISALLRIALQRGARVVPLDGGKAKRAGWLLATSEEALIEHEDRYLRDHAPRASFLRPFRAVADRIALRLAPGALDRGGSGGVITGLGLGMGAAAVVLGAYGWPRPAMGLLALASFVTAIGETLGGTLKAIRQKISRFRWFASASLLLFEAAFVVLCVLATERIPAVETGYLAFLFLGMVHLLKGMSTARIAEPMRDSTLVFSIGATCAALGFLDLALAAGVAALLGLMLFLQRGNKLTPA